tara:strand:- start:1310 stop:1870 length:561 start_codon:yes stop_codon:yes gene_type:complete
MGEVGGPRDDPATYGWSSVWGGQESTGEGEEQTRNPLGYTPKYDRDIYGVTAQAPSSYEFSDRIGMSVENVDPSVATATWPYETPVEYQMTTDAAPPRRIGYPGIPGYTPPFGRAIEDFGRDTDGKNALRGRGRRPPDSSRRERSVTPEESEQYGSSESAGEDGGRKMWKNRQDKTLRRLWLGEND